MLFKRRIHPWEALVIGNLLLIVVWWLVSVQVGDNSLFPTPWQTLARLGTDVLTVPVWSATWVTFTEALGGCLIAISVAVPLAYLIYRSTFLASLMQPFFAASQAIPAIAIAPILVIWVGYGLQAIMVLCAIIIFFPILVNTALGLSQVDKEILDAARLDTAGSWALLRYIEFPLALPTMLAGLRAGFTLSVTGAVVGEFVMGGTGLGNRLAIQSAAVDMTGLFSTIVVLCLMATLVYHVISQLERKANRLTLSIS
ncbi:ABC transporter permease [Boudabousia marimammalium]|uniref:ABC transporter permease n=1 Tax=Boudabousia marimammalium TaxID=156892 RepID=UPI000ACCC4F0|nr:ABC transporter permease subunit [Boudabousia marimammalium]